ncbi:hypothetical protein RHSIM_Rhsim01G0053300 [Rhododendron simsii]|uniref:Leucine-rich repeat-containing N-terminal plant-type domain-containing protein n=1 Tax=Rhododendron simsii TaxID=118357 RepID=A0A834HG37_RHOSS|nr:hypothetical protein RHSIM_Rhsim01G0053300 [Rhododendron simsii]
MAARVRKRNDGGIGILAELSNLEELDLSSNTLDKSILPSLNKLSNLMFLNLATNALNGSISTKEFGSLNNLKELDLSSNQVVSIITVNENGCNACWEKERIALLQPKDSSNFPNGNSLLSWEEDDHHSDCCQWEGVQCNSTTRQVIKLELNNTRDWGLIRWSLASKCLYSSPHGIAPKLRLASKPIASWNKSNLSNLENIDLRYNGLHNSILPSLNKLSNLKILNLAGNELNGSIFIKGKLKFYSNELSNSKA